MADIFISYADEDESRIRPVVEALEKLGWSVFWDRKIPPGHTWRDAIGAALESARAVVVAWSITSVKSRWVQEEADWGLHRSVLIPFFLEDVKPPLGFGAIQAADLTDWMGDPSHPGFQLLVGALSGLLGTTQPKRPAPPPAEPEFEKRRIDAVAPGNAALGQSMDVFVQVRFPDSEYLSIKDWPLKSKPASVVQASKPTNVRYPRNQEGKLNPAYLTVKVVAPEFKVEGEAERKIEIVPKQFSDLISFQLTPRALGDQRIMVQVYDENGVSVGELPVETHVNDRQKPIVREATIVVLDLNVLVLVEPSGAEARTIEPPAPTKKPPGKSPAAKTGLFSALSLLMVAGAAWMFVQQKSGQRPMDVQPAPVPQPPAAAGPSDPSPGRFVNGVGMEFVLIPQGSFTMGSHLGRASEKPPHHVDISQSFYLQTAEVSQGQWKKVMGNNPSFFKECGDDCPVEQVSWDDATEFIKKLNVIESTDRYRLPTEAEWEYACRAGMTTEFSFGDDETRLNEHAWYEGNSSEATHRGKTKKPNLWGLYDMHGHVWEWVEDDWHDWYDGSPAGSQAWVAKPRDSRRVIRGGSWESVEFDCRSAARFGEQPGNRSFSLGFRAAMDGPHGS